MSPSSGSPVTLTSVATLSAEGRLDDGLQRTSVRDAVTVYGSATQKLVLQPDQTGFDTYLWARRQFLQQFRRPRDARSQNIRAAHVVLIRFDLVRHPGGRRARRGHAAALPRAKPRPRPRRDRRARHDTQPGSKATRTATTPDPVGATYLTYDGNERLDNAGRRLRPDNRRFGDHARPRRGLGAVGRLAAGRRRRDQYAGDPWRHPAWKQRRPRRG